MEEYEKLDYRETMIKLYELRDQLELAEGIALSELPSVDCEIADRCGDCTYRHPTVWLGKLQLCDKCALDRIRVARRVALQG